MSLVRKGMVELIPLSPAGDRFEARKRRLVAADPTLFLLALDLIYNKPVFVLFTLLHLFPE